MKLCHGETNTDLCVAGSKKHVQTDLQTDLPSWLLALGSILPVSSSLTQLLSLISQHHYFQVCRGESTDITSITVVFQHPSTTAVDHVTHHSLSIMT